ncbi:hypothetical protein GOODEAATRI_022667, partial [Goodea atripinnis]
PVHLSELCEPCFVSLCLFIAGEELFQSFREPAAKLHFLPRPCSRREASQPNGGRACQAACAPAPSYNGVALMTQPVTQLLSQSVTGKKGRTLNRSALGFLPKQPMDQLTSADAWKSWCVLVRPVKHHSSHPDPCRMHPRAGKTSLVSLFGLASAGEDPFSSLKQKVTCLDRG